MCKLVMIKSKYFETPYYTAYRILVPQPGIEPRPREWKHLVLTAGPPGNPVLASKMAQTETIIVAFHSVYREDR